MKLQETSLSIWESKYQLKSQDGQVVDESIEDTFERVATALDESYGGGHKEEFFQALKDGAYPGGRIMANAGAREHKPTASLINCTVMPDIPDSMKGIMDVLGDAAMTLKAGCGTGYCFSSIRPRGAYVAGAGATTSGPIPFMDIYDKMCFTVSSAGGRRGAQMGTFSIEHPDVLEFIRAKREDGRLRNFNLSILVTDEFMSALTSGSDWEFRFPASETEKKMYPEQCFEGRNGVTYRSYGKVKASELWEEIMKSTYDYAEPGVLFIDRINGMNPLNFRETIMATNPCVTGDTRLHTSRGMVRMDELYKTQEDLMVTVDNHSLGVSEVGTQVRPAVPVFMTTDCADVYHLKTSDGYSLKATEWHELYTSRGKLKLKDIRVGDSLYIQSGKGQFGQKGSHDLGVLIGLMAGDGHFTNRGNGKVAASVGFWGGDMELADDVCRTINSMIVDRALSNRKYRVSPVPVKGRDMLSVRSIVLGRILDEEYGFNKDSKLKVPEVVWQGTEECVKGYLQGLFQADGTVQRDDKRAYCSIRLASSTPEFLEEIQILLGNFGIFSRVRSRRKAGMRSLPDGHGSSKKYACKENFELIIGSHSRDLFMDKIGFLRDNKNLKYEDWKVQRESSVQDSYLSEISSIEHIGQFPVYDTTQEDGNAIVVSACVSGNCGEQPLPPNGSCLLGSIDLTRFVMSPFQRDAAFNMERFCKVVKEFTRMLDSVVEISNLPLPSLESELKEKRRHGMGFFGLGSALTMMGIKYGSPESLDFVERVVANMVVSGFGVGHEMALDKGPCPALSSATARKKFVRSDYFKSIMGSISRIDSSLAGVLESVLQDIEKDGCRFTHHTSIAPTGTMALSFGNNASNGIEPTFSHHYTRNVIVPGEKTKRSVEVYSKEAITYASVKGIPIAEAVEVMSSLGTDASSLNPDAHISVQAAAQKYVDSSISKTINIPTEFPFDDFKGIYLTAYRQGLKGCTTFRFNPDVTQGVLVRKSDLENTFYVFETDSGESVRARGDEMVEYDGHVSTAANLFESIKEKTHGKY